MAIAETVAIAEDEAGPSVQKLLRATVTLRAVESRDFLAVSEEAGVGEADEEAPADNEITVCTATCVGEDLLLSFGCMPVLRQNRTVQTEYRITFPAGGQATARPRVVDQHSGLVLLRIEGGSPAGLTAIELAEALPEIGGKVLTAAAAGVEDPLVSAGIVSGMDRLVPGADLPPLLVCDVSTNAASSGAGLVDRKARLVGIVAAASPPGENFGWSYAVPLKYIRRVLEAQEPDKLVVLARMRPTLGVVLGPGERLGTVVVQHVVAGGPGDEAGLTAGDRIVGIEGRQVRSVYQAGAILRKHLPGERISLSCVSPTPGDRLAEEAQSLLETGDDQSPARHSESPVQRDVKVVLGSQSEDGAVSVPADVQTQTIKARFTRPMNIEVSNAARSYQFSLDVSENVQEPGGVEAEPTHGDSLQQRLREYEKVILALRQEAERQQEELARREQMVTALQDQLERLGEELAQLQQRQEAAE